MTWLAGLGALAIAILAGHLLAGPERRGRSPPIITDYPDGSRLIDYTGRDGRREHDKGAGGGLSS